MTAFFNKLAYIFCLAVAARQMFPATEQFSPFSFPTVDNPPVSEYTRHRYATSA
jgi:hypothetical protein